MQTPALLLTWILQNKLPEKFKVKQMMSFIGEGKFGPLAYIPLAELLVKSASRLNQSRATRTGILHTLGETT